MADSKITDLSNIVSILGVLPPETVLYAVHAGDDYNVTVGQILALVNAGDNGRIVQYGSWSTLGFFSVWADYKVLFGDTVVDVVLDYVAYYPCATGYTRYDRVEVDSDGAVSLVTGVESTGIPDKPAATAGKVTIGFLQISDSLEYWLPVSEGFITKDSQNFQAVFGAGAVTLPATENFNYALQPGVTQVDGIDAVLPSSPEFNRFGQEMKLLNASGGDIILKHSGTGLYFQDSTDFTLPSQHVASFFYDPTSNVWVFTGSSVQGGGGGLDEAGVRDTPLTGLPASTNTAITATDKVVDAFAKAQGQINKRLQLVHSEVLSADNPISASTTPAAMFLTSPSLEAGTYRIECEFTFSNSPSGGVTFSLSLQGTATVSRYAAHVIAIKQNKGDANTPRYTVVSSTSATVVSDSSTVTNGKCTFSGVLVVSSPGTVLISLSFSSGTATTNIEANSNFQIYKL